MKLLGDRGRGALFFGCVYMPTDSASVGLLEECYSKLTDDVLIFREQGKWCFMDILMLESAKLLIVMICLVRILVIVVVMGSSHFCMGWIL